MRSIRIPALLLAVFLAGGSAGCVLLAKPAYDQMKGKSSEQDEEEEEKEQQQGRSFDRWDPAAAAGVG